jgi:hypothetical protein
LPGRWGYLHWRNETGFSFVLYFLHCRRGIGTSIARTSTATKKRWARHWRQLWKQESLARTFLWHQNCGTCAHWALSSYYLSSHSLLSLDLIAFWFSYSSKSNQKFMDMIFNPLWNMWSSQLSFFANWEVCGFGSNEGETSLGKSLAWASTRIPRPVPCEWYNYSLRMLFFCKFL